MSRFTDKIFSGISKKVKIALGWMYFVSKVKPVSDFDLDHLPERPDYDDLRNWAAHPDQPNKALFTPSGTDSYYAGQGANADVFFIPPTTFFGRFSWNAPLDHLHANEMIDELVIPGQASVFNGSCRVFAPRYRQATFYSFLENNANGRNALELAYHDVARAFDHFIAHFNQGRPFFIASHSQGTLHAMRLLEEKIDDTSLAHRMVAAYAIGFRFPEEKFRKGHFKTLRPSQLPDDTGTILAWDTYSDNGGPSHWFDKAEHWYSTPDGRGEWKRRSHKKPICINPLSWKNSLEKVDRQSNLGAVHVDINTRLINWEAYGSSQPLGLNAKGLSKPHVHEVSAQCGEDGFLYISWPKSSPFLEAIMPGGNFHNYDYALFYMNIRENVAQRLKSFLGS